MSEFVEDDDADKVRAAIVEKYRRGPDGPVDPWEDASFIVYQVMDHYGFLHKNPLPPGRDAKMEETELERSGKWIKMFSNWKAYFHGDKPTEKLRRRVYKGIPPRVRGEAWKKMLNLQNVAQRGVYEKFKQIAIENSPDIRQIDLDVNRTYRDHIMFRERFGVKQQALFYVLAAYSMYNTDVGYCQGMSGICALLLMYMDEEQAFWALSELLTNRKHCMHGLFVPGFPKLLRFQNHHDRIMKKFLPKMQKHFENEGVFTSLYTLKWFMQCFLDRLPFSLVLRIYDVYLIDGDRILSAMAYHILKMSRKKLAKMDLEKIAPFLQEVVPNSHFNDDQVMEELQESMIELKRAKLDQCPPPGSNELPSKNIGTLPERNSFITASKRARASGDTKSIVEVPMGRPPSPTLNGKTQIVPVRNHHSAPRSRTKPLPSEYVDNQQQRTRNRNSTRSQETARRVSSPKTPTQSWETEVRSSDSHPNSRLNSINSEDSQRHTEEFSRPNGFVSPLTPVQDDGGSDYDNDDRKMYTHKTMVTDQTESFDLGYTEVNYATETRL